MDTQRLILSFVFSFSLLMLWDAWQKEQRPAASLPAPAAKSQGDVPSPARTIGPESPPAAPAQTSVPAVPAAAKPAVAGERTRVQTDLLIAEIDTLSGSLRRVELLKHKDSEDTSKNFVLLQPERHYEAQSGLTGEGGPNHRTLWTVIPGERQLQAGQAVLQVSLTAEGSGGIHVEKTYCGGTLQN